MTLLHSRTGAFSTLIHLAGASIILGAAACSGERDRPAGDRLPSDSAAFRVALLTPGPISDQSWNSGAYKGLLRIRDSLGASISHIQTKTPADFEENFRLYGRQGYALVFGHGFEFQDAASRVAPGFPRTVYITTSGNRFGDNVAPMVFGFEDPSYVAGVLAGSMTETGTIATLGGTELPPVRSGFLAFEAGARAANPQVRVLSSYVGSWEDASAGKEQAIAQIRRGADFIYQNADAAGLGVFQAAREASGQGRRVYVFGANSDQNEVAPDIVIASVVLDLPHAFLTVAREVKAGQFRGRVIALGTRERVANFVINPRLASRIPAAVMARLDSAQSRIARGTLRPPRLEFLDTAARPAAGR